MNFKILIILVVIISIFSSILILFFYSPLKDQYKGEPIYQSTRSN